MVPKLKTFDQNNHNLIQYYYLPKWRREAV